MFALDVLPSGEVISISVDGAERIPRLRTGIENSSTSLGIVVNPVTEFNCSVTSPRILVTETPDAKATRSTSTKFSSKIMVVTPTDLVEESQPITP